MGCLYEVEHVLKRKHFCVGRILERADPGSYDRDFSKYIYAILESDETN